jgi:glycosyltransferase involved in cell wall biosynthesis
MNITYFFRNPKIGYSIEKVFGIVTKEMRKHYSVEEVSTPSPNAMPWDVVRNSWYCFKNRNQKGINHITGHIHEVILGLFGCKTVVTIHDLVFLDNVKNPMKRFYKWLFWLYLPIKLADKIVCISHHTKRNIEKHLCSDKLVVIHNPIDPEYTFQPKPFNTQKPIILHIGTGWNKNLQNSIEALKGISCHLRIIGKLQEEIVDLLEANTIDYSNVYNLCDAEILQEYSNCDIVNFPSIYEGFGMPIIEGQAIGRVVLTSAIEPLLEISGDAVCFVNPHSKDSIREGLLKIINDAEFRNHLIKRGLENVKRFEAQCIAQQYIDLYNKI